MNTQKNSTTIDLEFCSPIPKGKDHGWTLEVQGQATILAEDGSTQTGKIIDLPIVEAASLDSKFAHWEYGLPPDVSYDGMAIRWGGVSGKPAGVLAVPYVNTPQGMLVGLFPEKRPLCQNGCLLPTVPGGFFDPEDRSAIEAITREFEEETNIKAEFFPLNRGQGIKDRAFTIIPEKGGNWDEVFAVKFDYSDLKMDPEFGLVLEKQPESPSNKTVGSIGKVRFVNALDHMLFGRDNISVKAVAAVYAAHQRGILP